MRLTSEEQGGGSRAAKQEGKRGNRAMSQKLNVFHMLKETSPPLLLPFLDPFKEWLPLGNSHEVREPPHFSALILTALPFLTMGSGVAGC